MSLGRDMRALMVGRSMVGKSSLVSHKKYQREYTPTIGFEYSQLRIGSTLSWVRDEATVLRLYELSGDKKFESLLPAHIKDSKFNFAIICCEKGSLNPKNDLEHYTKLIRKCAPSLPIFILLTKADLADKAESSPFISEFIKNTNNCYSLGEVSAKDNTREEIGDFFEEAVLHPSIKEEDYALDTFFEVHRKLSEQKWTPRFLSRTNISKNSSWEDLILDARHKKSSIANKAFLELKWLDNRGNVLNDIAPQEMIDADQNIARQGLQFKKLG